ncbi:hypothetical protein PR202_gb10786 [Eleusine coracana subsp. coracana]|uniref:No apical meristem-associated C-terminal domain-containing protein n=1 Tax=Eleusine coracana subsp. coracana TaxID=191504 RepID=A0AAV5EK50_ELECO|nr:hypothetical protein PR202_gb10786 [Eleusine coracana subsp. coracana]
MEDDPALLPARPRPPPVQSGPCPNRAPKPKPPRLGLPRPPPPPVVSPDAGQGRSTAMEDGADRASQVWKRPPRDPLAVKGKRAVLQVVGKRAVARAPLERAAPSVVLVDDTPDAVEASPGAIDASPVSSPYSILMHNRCSMKCQQVDESASDVEVDVPKKKSSKGCNFTVNIAQRLYKGKPTKKGGKSGKAFALHHCWVLFEHDEKWRTRNLEVPTKSKKSSNFSSLYNDEHEDIDSNDGDSDGKRSPTPSSMPYKEKRPPGRKASKEKLKKSEECVYKESLDNMVASRKELAADRKEFKAAQWVTMKEMEERRTVAEERRSAAQERSVIDERRAAADERRAAVEEQRVAIEERRIAAEEASKRLEQEQKIMFMDSSNLDEKGRAYFELMRDQILASRTSFFMGGFMGGNGGNGGNTDGGGGIIE